MLEVVWYIALKLSIFAAIISIVAGVVSMGMIVFLMSDDGYGSLKDDEKKSFLGFFKVIAGIAIVFAPLAVVPSPDDLFHIRLGMLKYTMASPENVTKGMAEIERIAAKLECKYLGCEEKKSDATSN